MEGDRKDSEVRDFLSLGSSGGSGGGERAAIAGAFAGASAGGEPLERNLTMLSALSRNHGLKMLAGDSGGGFGMRPPPMGNLSGMPSLGNLTLGGGRFAGFSSPSVPKTAWGRSPAGMGLRFVSKGAQVRDEAGASSSHPQGSGIVGKLELPLQTEVENLTPAECWNLVLKLGKDWPAWNETTASQLSEGMIKYRSSRFEGVDPGHHLQMDERLGGKPGNFLEQGSLNLLIGRALEALARTLDIYGRPAGSMSAPKLTTQEILNNKAARDLPIPTSQSAHPTLAVFQQPASSAKPPTPPSRVMAAPMTSSARPLTAPLTIFYDGKMNVCDNVPEEKARIIMRFAESSAKNRNAPSSASPQITPGPVLAPQESARPQLDLQLSQPPHSVTVTGTSSVPSHLITSTDHPEGSSSHQKSTESSNPAEAANAAPSSMPFRIPSAEVKSRQLMQQSLNGPVSRRLPNSRKNSLARFLDSRKRNRQTTSSSEDQPSKKQELGSPSDGCPSAADDMKEPPSRKSPLGLCSQPSIDSKEGTTAMSTADAEMKTNDSLIM